MESQHTLLTIVRHGQTDANIDKVWAGSTNSPLTPHGQKQAQASAHFIHTHYRPIENIYASPLDRAHDTARAIADPLALTPEIDPDLAEFDLGDWEGKSFKSLHENERLFQNMKSDPHFRPHGGESPVQVGDRLTAALRRIADKHPGERVVVVSHGGALSIAFGLLLDNDYSRWNRMMDNCAITELVLAPEPALLSFNLTDHLPLAAE